MATQQIYRQLIAEYPATQAGQNAIVTLAQLELSVLNKGESAIELFNLYLRQFPTGYLGNI